MLKVVNSMNLYVIIPECQTQKAHKFYEKFHKVGTMTKNRKNNKGAKKNTVNKKTKSLTQAGISNPPIPYHV